MQKELPRAERLAEHEADDHAEHDGEDFQVAQLGQRGVQPRSVRFRSAAHRGGNTPTRELNLDGPVVGRFVLLCHVPGILLIDLCI